MNATDKSNIIISSLIAIVSGLLFLTFAPEVSEFTKTMRENPFESFVVLVLILIVVLLLHLTVRKDEKTTPK